LLIVLLRDTEPSACPPLSTHAGGEELTKPDIEKKIKNFEESDKVKKFEKLEKMEKVIKNNFLDNFFSFQIFFPEKKI
jgi:hypothetical protein